ncbi:MAG: hypothetical protein IT380_10315 [Myxococcales bacterium]|nr:hypothetical protein [Myxococcales bacterium]
MRRFLALLTLCAAVPALAQKEEIFGSGKPPTYREEKMDKKFAKSRVAKLLDKGTDEPACVQLLGGLFVALAEIIPSLHKRDENFSLDPTLVEAVNTQLTTPQFPAMAYLVSMVRKVMITGHLPDTWLETATQLNKTVKIIDLPKLKSANESISLADSSYFTIPLLKQRYYAEVLGANSAVTTDVVATFRDAWLDRDVAWGGANLVDVGINQPKGKKKKKYRLAEAEELVAVLQWIPPDPRKKEIDLMGQHPTRVDPIVIYARLQPKQYTDIEKLFRGQRIMLKGRFWEMNKQVTELEVRDAVVFNETDWSQGVVLANPAEISACSAAINELTGIAPDQPGGFKH